jgi:hypothetical protein
MKIISEKHQQKNSFLYILKKYMKIQIIKSNAKIKNEINFRNGLESIKN